MTVCIVNVSDSISNSWWSNSWAKLWGSLREGSGYALCFFQSWNCLKLSELGIIQFPCDDVKLFDINLIKKMIFSITRNVIRSRFGTVVAAGDPIPLSRPQKTKIEIKRESKQPTPINQKSPNGLKSRKWPSSSTESTPTTSLTTIPTPRTTSLTVKPTTTPA